MSRGCWAPVRRLKEIEVSFTSVEVNGLWVCIACGRLALKITRMIFDKDTYRWAVDGRLLDISSAFKSRVLGNLQLEIDLILVMSS
jgi:hypothetical protein